MALSAPAHPSSEIFRAEVAQTDDRTMVALYGELDLAVAAEAEHALLIAEHSNEGPIVVDLARLRFLDVRGLRVLLDAHARLGDRLTVLPGPPAVQQLFELTNTADRLPFA